MTILVLGQERTGTHTIVNMLKASGIEASHETEPTLCFEAYSRVVKGSFKTDNITAKIKSVTGKAEANHRLQFFADILAEKIPDAKFIFLVRDPVKTIISMIGTMAYWPGRTELPKWIFEKIGKHETKQKKEFNLYRIPPQNEREPLAIKHLQSWLRGLAVSLPMLEKLDNRLKLMKTGKICPEGHLVWQWLGLNWTEEVTNSACCKTNSMYNMFGEDSIADWAQEQVNPHINRIHEEFCKILSRYPLGKKILHMIYHKT